MRYTLVVVLVAFFFFSCTSKLDSNVVQLSPEDLKERIKGKDILLLDVRTKAEVNEGIITGAVNYNFHSSDFKKSISTLEKSKEVVVYCRSGGRSNKAASMLVKNGFKKVYNLNGGIMGWKKIGGKVVSSK